jgi:hypothetical protein
VRKFGAATVEIRCGPCQSRMGAASPIMGHVVDGGDGNWQVARWKPRPGHIGRARYNDADTDEIYAPGKGTRGIELRCRRCGHAPRLAIDRLIQQASETTLRNGKGDLYV